MAPHLVVVLGELQHLLDHLLVGAAVVVEVGQRQTVDPTLFVQVQQHLGEMKKMRLHKVTKSETNWAKNRRRFETICYFTEH